MEQALTLDALDSRHPRALAGRLESTSRARRDLSIRIPKMRERTRLSLRVVQRHLSHAGRGPQRRRSERPNPTRPCDRAPYRSIHEHYREMRPDRFAFATPPLRLVRLLAGGRLADRRVALG